MYFIPFKIDTVQGTLNFCVLYKHEGASFEEANFALK